MSAGMTSEELRELYRRYVEMANTRDFDGMRELLHDEVILNGTPVASDAIITEFHKHTDAVPDIHWEIQELLVDGGHIAARALDTGTPEQEWNGLAPTGASFSFAEVAFYEVVDGRFKHMWYMMDVDSLRAQLTEQAR
ncbi:ester cyclase [Actinopolymorpha pittospori]